MRCLAKKYILFITILSFLFVSCVNENTEDDPVEPPVDTEKYTLIDLKYIFSDKKEVEFEQLLKTIEYNNPTNSEQKLPINNMSSIRNFMFFQSDESDDEIVDYFFRDSIVVNIPEYIDDERIYLILKLID